MNSPEPQHLNADELDAFLTGTAPQQAVSHLATCESCTEMVARDGRLVAMMAALPYFDAAPGLGDAVIRGLTPRQAPAVVLAVPTPRAVAARRRAIGALVFASGAIAAVFVWAAAHPADALRWSGPALQDAGHSLWLSLQTVVANATEQPWFSSLRDTMGSPARALFAAAAAAGAYALALVGLRRLMTEPATDAGW